ncbi:hypothetical protein ACFVGM_08580 [Kitasatospora purpeofusca]|uniref:hypothetical protein n=1 Tax=Kitasatospora purpeofusca TaxID=67352 RepID=UPI00368BBB7E
MANLDLQGYNLGALETTFVLTRQQPDGEQKIIEASTDMNYIDGLRGEREEADANRAGEGPELTRYRVYSVRPEVKELYRTVLPGDLRFEVAERTTKIGERERQEWTVTRIGATPSFSSPILDEADAQLVCDFQNKIPDGYRASYGAQVGYLMGVPKGPGVKIYYQADYTPDTRDDWRSERSFEQLDLLLHEIERHHATEDERRAKYAAEQEEKTRRQANRRFAVAPLDESERSWFFMPAKALAEIQDNGETLWVTKGGRFVIEDRENPFDEPNQYSEAALEGAADWLVKHEIDPAEYESLPQELLAACASREY